MPDMLSNTSCLIALDNIGQLELLHRVYDIIHISDEVAAEFGGLVPAWIKVHSVQDKTKLDILHNLVDLGEASTIALAYQFNDVTLILDDRKARKLADNLKLLRLRRGSTAPGAGADSTRTFLVHWRGHAGWAAFGTLCPRSAAGSAVCLSSEW